MVSLQGLIDLNQVATGIRKHRERHPARTRWLTRENHTQCPLGRTYSFSISSTSKAAKECPGKTSPLETPWRQGGVGLERELQV